MQMQESDIAWEWAIGCACVAAFFVGMILGRDVDESGPIDDEKERNPDPDDQEEEDF